MPLLYALMKEQNLDVFGLKAMFNTTFMLILIGKTEKKECSLWTMHSL